MAIYELTHNGFMEKEKVSFSSWGIRERDHLQKAFRASIEAISPSSSVSTMVLAEEFCSWDGSNRRIDLLCLDSDGTLVVVELKREGSAHMELQALRYAAMVSTMRFEQAVQAYAESEQCGEDEARDKLQKFLGPDGTETLSDRVRIVLVASEFSTEVTTTVLWLNQHGLDIRCVELQPYEIDGRIFVDIQQIIPLPQAAEYQVAVREKNREKEEAETKKRKRYQVIIDGEVVKNNLYRAQLAFTIVSELIRNNSVTPEQLRAVVPWRSHNMFIEAEGVLDSKEMGVVRRDNNKRSLPERFFMEENELFYVNGKTYALSRAWGDRTVPAVDAMLNTSPNRYGIQFQENP